MTDPDHDEASVIAQNLTTAKGGHFKIAEDGQWSYTYDKAAAQHLAQGESFTERFTVTSIDGTASHEIAVTVHGTNDTPVVSSAVSLAAGTEDIDVTLTEAQLLANASDVDHGETKQLTVHNLHADHGTITDNNDGTFTFHPEANYNGAVSFTYDVQDPQGASVSTSASMNLTAVRDAATISGTDTGSVTEDHNVDPSSAHTIMASGLLNVIDPDAGEDHFYFKMLGERAIHDPFGGSLHITPSGAWGYEVSNNNLQYLTEGETEQVIYRVYSADYTPHDITITVTGTNDAPLVSSAVTLASGTEDTDITIHASDLLANASDVDHGETKQLTVHNLHADHGTITDNKDGTFTFHPDKDYNGAVSFTYDVQDPHGGSAPTCDFRSRTRYRYGCSWHRRNSGTGDCQYW